MKLLPIAFLGSILMLGIASVSGWGALLYKDRPEQGDQLNRIALAEGLQLDRHIAEMQGAPVRTRRAACGSGGGGSGGGGGRGIGGRSFGGGGGGGGGGIERISVVGRRLPSHRVSIPTVLRGYRTSRFGGGGGGSRSRSKPKPSPKPAPPEDPEAKKMTLEQFVFALELLETLFPNLPADQMANKLRMLVGRYDSAHWRVILNVNNPFPGFGKTVNPFGSTVDQPTLQTLTQMMDHRFQNGAELGVIKMNGDTIAFGHVITGATAGYDQQSVLGMNNIFATTISGDLGQSGLANAKNPSSPIIGPSGQWQNGKYMLPSKGGLATNAEILGDIDGVNMGKRIQANPGKPLSQHFKEYYGGESSRRFDIFKQHTTRAELTQEVYRFANLYEVKTSGLWSSIAQRSNPDLAARTANRINGIANRAVGTFCSRYSSKLGSWC